MLSKELQVLLKLVAETKNEKQIDAVIKKVQELSPRNFFQGDTDPALARRVFQHQPSSSYWSGRAISKEKAYGNE
jgi:hypothetical protein